MENEIKVNDYVRTKAGQIHKVDKIIPVYENDKLLYEQQFLCWDGKISGYRIWQLEDIIVKHSPNLIDIIEDEDFCKIEFYSPRYEKRGTRIFEVSKIDEYITFENMHCDLFMIKGEWSNNAKRLNPVIKEIYTKEMMEFISYKVERKN